MIVRGRKDTSNKNSYQVSKNFEVSGVSSCTMRSANDCCKLRMDEPAGEEENGGNHQLNLIQVATSIRIKSQISLHCASLHSPLEATGKQRMVPSLMLLLILASMNQQSCFSAPVAIKPELGVASKLTKDDQGLIQAEQAQQAVRLKATEQAAVMVLVELAKSNQHYTNDLAVSSHLANREDDTLLLVLGDQLAEPQLAISSPPPSPSSSSSASSSSSPVRRLIKRSGISDQRLAEIQMIRALKKQLERASKMAGTSNLNSAGQEAIAS